MEASVAFGPLNNKQIKKEESRSSDIYAVPPLPDNLEDELRHCLDATDENDERVMYLRWLIETLPLGTVGVLDDLTESEDPKLALLPIILIPEILRRAVPQDNRVFSYDELDRLRDNFAYLMDSEFEEVAGVALEVFTREADYWKEYDVTTYGWLEQLAQPEVAKQALHKRYSDDIARLAVSHATM